MANSKDLSGVWHIRYWYQGSVRGGEHTSEYYAQIHQKSNRLIIESLGNTNGSYLLVRLSLDGRIATGTWHEETSPKHFHVGISYYGALQLILSEDNWRMDGRWVGFGRDMKVSNGVCEIVRAGHSSTTKAHSNAIKQSLSVKT